MLFFVLFISSCEKNDNMNLVIKQMENRIEKLENENKLKNVKIQSLMSELSTCKASKIKYIENKDDFDIIDGDEDKEDRFENSNTVKVETKTDEKLSGSKNNSNKLDLKEEKEEKKEFPYPQDIEGQCRKSDINRVFHNLRTYYDKCFLQNKVKRAKLGFSWDINKNGRVENIKVIKNNIFNRNLSNCLKVVLSSGRYNSPREGTCRVKYIFNLR